MPICISTSFSLHNPSFFKCPSFCCLLNLFFSFLHFFFSLERVVCYKLGQSLQANPTSLLSKPLVCRPFLTLLTLCILELSTFMFLVQSEWRLQRSCAMISLEVDVATHSKVEKRATKGGQRANTANGQEKPRSRRIRRGQGKRLFLRRRRLRMLQR